MPNRQSWTISFWITYPSGKKDVIRADVKVYFEDEMKSQAYFDCATLKVWDRDMPLDEEELNYWHTHLTTIGRTLDYYTLLPAHIEKKSFAARNGWHGFSAHRNSRNK